MSEEIDKKNDAEGEKGEGFEILAGLVLSVFAAILAVSSLFADKLGGDEQIANTKESEPYAWQQSKTIKKSLAENLKDQSDTSKTQLDISLKQLDLLLST